MEPDHKATSDIDRALHDWQERWLPAIRTQVLKLQNNRQLHDGFMELLHDGRPTGGGIFEDFFHRMYLEAQTLGVRRQCDSDGHSLSLLRLIRQIEHHRRDFTREWYVAGWLAAWREDRPDGDAEDQTFSRQDANAIFDRYTAESGDEMLSGTQLQRDREELLEASAKVNAFVNRTVAHIDGRGVHEDVTYAEFHENMEHVAATFDRYHLLINRSSFGTTTPIVPLDWLAPFWGPEEA